MRHWKRPPLLLWAGGPKGLSPPWKALHYRPFTLPVLPFVL